MPSEPLSLARVEELERLLADATPQPWAVEGDFMVTRDPVEIDYERCAIADLRYFHLPRDKANSALIAAAVNALPALLTLARTSLDRPGGGDQAEALKRAAAQFQEYARQHRAKATPEADAKAAVNDSMAEMCLAALTTPPPNPSRDKLREGIAELRQRLYGNRADLVQDQKVNGARHPGLLPPHVWGAEDAWRQFEQLEPLLALISEPAPFPSAQAVGELVEAAKEFMRRAPKGDRETEHADRLSRALAAVGSPN